MLRTFVLPVNAHDPPTRAIVEELNAVNATHKWFRIVRIVARFVRAPNMSNMPKQFRLPRYLFFEESIVREVCGATGNEPIDVEQLRRDPTEIYFSGIFRCWN
jgi:hypothetical protein